MPLESMTTGCRPRKNLVKSCSLLVLAQADAGVIDDHLNAGADLVREYADGPGGCVLDGVREQVTEDLE